MRYRCFEKTWVLRFERGEEIVSALKAFCAEHGIALAAVSGIGAADRVTIGCFKTGTKEYIRKELIGDHEITGLAGTVSTMGGRPYLHLHVTLADSDWRTFGGHLDSAVVSGTCEVVLHPIEGRLERVYDEQVGLNLLKL